MRLAVLSDLHVDTDPWDFRSESIAHLEALDAVIVAGDVSDDAVTSIEWLGERLRRVPVYYVFGNHDDRGVPTRLEGRQQARKQAARRYPNLTILDREETRIGDWRILGCTLWVDFACLGDPADNMKRAETINRDHRTITVRGSGAITSFDAAAMLAEHRSDLQWLRSRLVEQQERPTLVVTHHPPLLRSVLLDPGAVAVAPMMASDLPDILKEYAPEIWVHGHVHHRCDYTAFGTRVLANPRGAEPFFNGAFNEVEVLDL